MGELGWLGGGDGGDIMCKVLLYNIGQGQWVSLVGLEGGWGWGLHIYRYKIYIQSYYITLDKANG